MFLILLATVAVCAATDNLSAALQSPQALQSLFAKFSSDHHRAYTNVRERRMRLGIFTRTVREAAEHNAGDSSWQRGVNKFADMTDEERYSYTGANLTLAAEEEGGHLWEAPLAAVAAASSKDWRATSVTKIKDQGACGSCWTFSALGSLEGQYKNKGSILKSFSEQEILECSQKRGCKGGWMFKAYRYIRDSGRLATMKDAPYKAKEGSCNFDSVRNGMKAFKVTSYNNAKGEEGNIQALNTVGPIAVMFSVTRKFFEYTGGIYTEGYCSGGSHAVTNVGYAPDHFIMKNSWGRSFGEKGYFRIARGNVCGINTMGYFPVLESTGMRDTDPDETGSYDDIPDDNEDGNDDDDDDEKETCTDDNADCAAQVARDPNVCVEKWSTMTVRCRASCGQCTCKDIKSDCRSWKSQCGTSWSQEFLSKVCRKTCGKCHDDKKDDDDKNDDNDNGGCKKGFKKCPDGSCVHQHWTC